MGNIVLITEADGSTTQKGVWRTGTQAEVNAGTAGVVVTADTLKNFPSSYTPLPFLKFNSSTKAQSNHAYGLVSPDVSPPVPLELPDIGSFEEGDVIEVDNISGVSFKITIPSGSSVELRYDNQLLIDIDNKFLLSEGAGSSIKLRAENSQLWYVVRRDRVTVSS
jgi:hypothetical protein